MLQKSSYALRCRRPYEDKVLALPICRPKRSRFFPTTMNSNARSSHLFFITGLFHRDGPPLALGRGSVGLPSLV